MHGHRNVKKIHDVCKQLLHQNKPEVNAFLAISHVKVM